MITDDLNKWHMIITKPIMFQLFIDLISFVFVILVNFYCYTAAAGA